MCIIASAAKKRHMHRDEVLESMRVNSSGFFMCALKPDGTRKTIRTLDQKEAIGFFDDEVKDDDAFVMHARIPSRGAKNIDNVHGWESDGILFMHNMTITDIDDMMKRVKWDRTDSEFFFRKIFIPYYRGLGKEAYKDGNFHPDLDNLVNHFVGYSNKFCFIMPDNKVIRYGTWVSEPDRKENGEIAFYASNSGYKVFTQYGKNAGKGGTAAGAAGFRNHVNGFGAGDYDDYDDYYGYRTYYGYGECAADPKRTRRKKGTARQVTTATTAAATQAKKTQVSSGEMLLKLAGIKGVCQIAVAHLVLENAVDCRFIYSENKTEEKVQKVLRDFFPACCIGTYKAVKEAFKELSKSEENGLGVSEVTKHVEEFATKIAGIYEEKLYKDKSPYAITPSEWAVKLGIEATIERMNILLRMNNVAIDFKNTDPTEFVKAYVMANDGSELEEVFIEDLLGLDILAQDAMTDAVQMILCVLNECVEKFFPEDDDDTLPAPETDKQSDNPEQEDLPHIADDEVTSTDYENEIENPTAEITGEVDDTNFEVGDEEVDIEDTGLNGGNYDQDTDPDSTLGAA